MKLLYSYLYQIFDVGMTMGTLVLKGIINIIHGLFLLIYYTIKSTIKCATVMN